MKKNNSGVEISVDLGNFQEAADDLLKLSDKDWSQIPFQKVLYIQILSFLHQAQIELQDLRTIVRYLAHKISPEEMKDAEEIENIEVKP